MTRFALIIAVFIANAFPVGAMEFGARQIDGPITADVLRVLDGDTVEVRAYPWPQQSIDVLVRLRGIDAPEIHAKCDRERSRANLAKERLSTFVAGQRHVFLTDIGGDKYFGRVLANLGLADGNDAASALILEDLVRPYDGGRKPPTDC
jgi:micrococcal nuclease